MKKWYEELFKIMPTPMKKNHSPKEQKVNVILSKNIGFKKIDIFGAKLGAFSRKDKLTTEDYEMLVIAEK